MTSIVKVAHGIASMNYRVREYSYNVKRNGHDWSRVVADANDTIQKQLMRQRQSLYRSGALPGESYYYGSRMSGMPRDPRMPTKQEALTMAVTVSLATGWGTVLTGSAILGDISLGSGIIAFALDPSAENALGVALGGAGKVVKIPGITKAMSDDAFDFYGATYGTWSTFGPKSETE